MISRRTFLASTGVVMVAPSFLWADSKAEDRFPSALDHIILGCSDLDRGIAFVEEHTGVRAAFGGVHPDRGTMNALASLGERHYLEIMAPNPKATAVQPWAKPRLEKLRELTTPHLVTWAVHSSDIEGLAKKIRAAGIAIADPTPGSRVRPDGRVLKWKSFTLADDHHGVLPFFIEWGADSVHPSVDAPAGCHLERLIAADQDHGALSKALERLGVDVVVERAEGPQLRARISGPKGSFDASS